MRNKLGFTLIELMLVLSIISILAIAAFSYTSFFVRQHEQLLKNQIISLLEIAQQEALNGSDVGLCRSLDATSCQDQGDYWLLFFDVYHDGSIQQQSQIIRSHHLMLKQGYIVLRSYPHYRSYLRFSSSVLAEGDNATIGFYRSKKAAPAWRIAINRSGRAREVLPAIS